MQRYEVLTFTLCGWVNCWLDDREKPITFVSQAAADAAIENMLTDANEAVREGDMLDAPARSDFRIVPTMYATGGQS